MNREQARDEIYDALAAELDVLDDFALNEAIAGYIAMSSLGGASSELAISTLELLSVALKLWQERHPLTFPPCFGILQTAKKASSPSDELFGVSYVYKWPRA